ncbi:MAG: HIT family protein [Hungatella sp.]|jgi:histidine triad (HIT) family protein|nr:HIT family protein [Hungatella sp.]
MVKDDCIFCKLANGVIPTASLYEDDTFRVILDANPASKGHALILPKHHYQDLCELDEAVGEKVLKVAAKIGKAMKEGLGCAGFNLVQNNGEAAGQTVMHFHMHVIPRYEGGSKMVTWESGKVSAEETERIVEAVTPRL